MNHEILVPYLDIWIRWVRRREINVPLAVTKELQRRLAADCRRHHVAILRRALFADNHDVAFLNARSDHAVAIDAEGETGSSSDPLGRNGHPTVRQRFCRNGGSRNNATEERHSGHRSHVVQPDKASSPSRELKVPLPRKRSQVITCSAGGRPAEFLAQVAVGRRRIPDVCPPPKRLKNLALDRGQLVHREGMYHSNEW